VGVSVENDDGLQVQPTRQQQLGRQRHNLRLSAERGNQDSRHEGSDLVFG
jgi:hypothetical protein